MIFLRESGKMAYGCEMNKKRLTQLGFWLACDKMWQRLEVWRFKKKTYKSAFPTNYAERADAWGVWMRAQSDQEPQDVLDVWAFLEKQGHDYIFVEDLLCAIGRSLGRKVISPKYPKASVLSFIKALPDAYWIWAKKHKCNKFEASAPYWVMAKAFEVGFIELGVECLNRLKDVWLTDLKDKDMPGRRLGSECALATVLPYCQTVEALEAYQQNGGSFWDEIEDRGKVPAHLGGFFGMPKEAKERIMRKQASPVVCLYAQESTSDVWPPRKRAETLDWLIQRLQEQTNWEEPTQKMKRVWRDLTIICQEKGDIRRLIHPKLKEWMTNDHVWLASLAYANPLGFAEWHQTWHTKQERQKWIEQGLTIDAVHYTLADVLLASGGGLQPLGAVRRGKEWPRLFEQFEMPQVWRQKEFNTFISKSFQLHSQLEHLFLGEEMYFAAEPLNLWRHPIGNPKKGFLKAYVAAFKGAERDKMALMRKWMRRWIEHASLAEFKKLLESSNPLVISSKVILREAYCNETRCMDLKLMGLKPKGDVRLKNQELRVFQEKTNAAAQALQLLYRDVRNKNCAVDGFIGALSLFRILSGGGRDAERLQKQVNIAKKNLESIFRYRGLTFDDIMEHLSKDEASDGPGLLLRSASLMRRKVVAFAESKQWTSAECFGYLMPEVRALYERVALKTSVQEGDEPVVMQAQIKKRNVL